MYKIVSEAEAQILRGEFVLLSLAGKYTGIDPLEDAQPTVQHVMRQLRNAAELGHPFAPYGDDLDAVFALLMAGRINPLRMITYVPETREPVPGVVFSVMLNDLDLEMILWVNGGEDIWLRCDRRALRSAIAHRYPDTWGLLCARW